MDASDLDARTSGGTYDEGNPYVLRQAVMLDVLGHAAHEESGIVYLPSPTGSGKTHVAAEFAARLVTDGMLPNDEREWPEVSRLLFVVPGRENRDAFAVSARECLRRLAAEGGNPVSSSRGSELDGRVIVSRSSVDAAMEYLYVRRGDAGPWTYAERDGRHGANPACLGWLGAYEGEDGPARRFARDVRDAYASVEEHDGRDNARTIAATRLCTLALEDDGSLSYSERTLLATLGDGEGYSACSHLIRVDGKGQVWPERERTYVRFADGSETLIEPTDLYTLPNQLRKMFADMNDGKRARTGERRNLYLSPLCGIGSFVDGGFVYYFVGNDTHFNTTVRRAVPIRRMWCVSGVDHSGELLALMDVGFVRYVRQTVLPYPVKMLREFWSMRRGMGDDRRP